MTTPISSVSQASDLARAIVSNFDTNRDGKLSTDEFGAFLTNLVAGLQSSNGSTASGGPETQLPPDVQSPIGTEPSQPTVSSGSIDDSDYVFDFGGTFFTNMPTLPTPPGLGTEPDRTSGVLGGTASAGSPDTPPLHD